MTISTECPECGKRLKAPDSAAGRKARCPRCGAAVPIPEPVYDAEEADEFDEGDSYALERYEEFRTSAPPPRRHTEDDDHDRRPCPMCGEMIRVNAAKCRYCGEAFDPALRKAAGRRERSETGGEMTVVDWLLCVLCPGIGCIVGIVASVQGDSTRGGKMVGFGILFAVVWNVIRVALEAME